MKRNTKTVMAFVLTLLLIATFPVAVFADTPTSGTINGSSTVDTVVVNVVLPTSLSFALDPLGLDTTGDNQIATQDFFFVNQTFAPVKVSIDIDAETSGGAVLVSTTGGLSLDDTSVTDKDLYFGVLGATGLTGTAITTTAAGVSYSSIFTTTGPAAEYATVSAVAETLATLEPGSDGTTGSAVISFALDKAVESATTAGSIESLAASDKGVAAFQFYSQLNTYAEWEANDITVTGAYTLIPLRDTTYTGYDYIAGSLNQLVAEEEETPAVTPDVTLTAGTPTASYSFNLPDKFGASAPGLLIGVTGAAGTTITTATWGSGVDVKSYMTLADGIITFNAEAWATNNTYAETLTIVADGKTYTITTLTGVKP